MTDTVDRVTRSRNMSRIRNKNTKPELLVRKHLHSRGFRYKLNDKSLPGHPDLVLPKYKAVILVHGCFWHRHKNCRIAYTPKSRLEFWTNKFEANVIRDARVKGQLIDSGWRVLIIWECSTRSKQRAEHLKSIEAWLHSTSNYAEISADDFQKNP